MSTWLRVWRRSISSSNADVGSFHGILRRLMRGSSVSSHRFERNLRRFEMELRRRSWVLGALFISLLFCGFGGTGCLGFAVNRRPKNVQVSLRAKWAGTSLLLESG
ncbi:hypothetical protein GW17_00019417 [Ensete ventricosum]|nr:hypothetical protein GW17_00019417 [Ensete ventricosum]